MNDTTDIKEKRSTKKWLSISTIFYICLFPFLFYFSLFSFMVFDNPNMTTVMGIFFIFLFLTIPISIPVSVFLMWRRYFQMQYSKASFHCCIPIITLVASYFLIDFFGMFV